MAAWIVAHVVGIGVCAKVQGFDEGIGLRIRKHGYRHRRRHLSSDLTEFRDQQMGAAVSLRADLSAGELRLLAKRADDADRRAGCCRWRPCSTG